MSLQPMRRRDREGVHAVTRTGFATQEKKNANEFLRVKANETNAAKVTENGAGDVLEGSLGRLELTMRSNSNTAMEGIVDHTSHGGKVLVRLLRECLTFRVYYQG